MLSFRKSRIVAPNQGGKNEKPGSSPEPGFVAGPSVTRVGVISDLALVMVWPSELDAENTVRGLVAVDAAI
jgi:hypothetical protein